LAVVSSSVGQEALATAVASACLTVCWPLSHGAALRWCLLSGACYPEQHQRLCGCCSDSGWFAAGVLCLCWGVVPVLGCTLKCVTCVVWCDRLRCCCSSIGCLLPHAGVVARLHHCTHLIAWCACGWWPLCALPCMPNVAGPREDGCRDWLECSGESQQTVLVLYIAGIGCRVASVWACPL
jgi:hypothetical protein